MLLAEQLPQAEIEEIRNAVTLLRRSENLSSTERQAPSNHSSIDNDASNAAVSTLSESEREDRTSLNADISALLSALNQQRVAYGDGRIAGLVTRLRELVGLRSTGARMRLQARSEYLDCLATYLRRPSDVTPGTTELLRKRVLQCVEELGSTTVHIRLLTQEELIIRGILAYIKNVSGL